MKLASMHESESTHLKLHAKVEVSWSRCILIVLEGETNTPPRPFKSTVGGCMVGAILAGAGLNLLLQPNTMDVTGQLPPSIAQLLIKCIPALRSTRSNDATVISPVLHRHADAILAFGSQQDPIFILRHIATPASRVSPAPVLLFALDTRLFERAGGLQRGYTPLGSSSTSLRVGIGG